MARVFIPVALRSLTGGQQIVDAEGKNLREVIGWLEARYPGIRDRLCQDDELDPSIAVAVGGSIAALGLLEPVPADAEVHFLPAVGGG